MKLPDSISLKATDTYFTPRWFVEDVVELLWPFGVGLDPFWAEGCHVNPARKIDCRQGGNAYTDAWHKGPGSNTALVNGPFSGLYPAATAKRCVLQYLAHNIHSINILPCTPGSDYWRKYILPHFDAVAFLGRVGFEAGADIFDSDGNLTCPKGEARNGNRTEIAAVYMGPAPGAFRELVRPHAGSLLRGCF